MEGDCIMNKDEIDTIIQYIDKKIEYELASTEKDEEGHAGSCVAERKEMEAAKEKLYKL
jgi:hypothetical protein